MLVVILVPSLFAFALAFIDPYVENANAIDALEAQLEQQILSMDGNIPDITDPRRHYALLITHIAIVAHHIAHECGASYEDVYLAMLPESILYAFTNVQAIIDETATAIKLVNQDTNKLRTVMNSLCPVDESSDICDQIITEIVTGDNVRYLEESLVLSAAGSTASSILNRHLVDVANKYEAMQYLLTRMVDLGSVVNDLVMLITKVERLAPCSE